MSRRKGQTSLEYGFLLVCIAAAILGMQFYVKRAMQGRVKQAADQIGYPYDANSSIWITVSRTNSTTAINTTMVNVTQMTGVHDQYGAVIMGVGQNVTQDVNITTNQDDSVSGTQ